MAYCTPADVATVLGVTFTPEEEAQAEQLIAAAEDWIDEFTQQTWAASTPILAERHRIEGPRVYLRVVPLAHVDAVSWAPGYVGATPSVIAATSGYQLVNATTGELRIANYGYGDLLVDYTPAVTPPPAIQDACTRMVAGRMAAATDPSGQTLPPDVKRVQVGGEWAVERFSATELAGEVQNVLSSLRLKQRVVLA